MNQEHSGDEGVGPTRFARPRLKPVPRLVEMVQWCFSSIWAGLDCGSKWSYLLVLAMFSCSPLGAPIFVPSEKPTFNNIIQVSSITIQDPHENQLRSLFIYCNSKFLYLFIYLLK